MKKSLIRFLLFNLLGISPLLLFGQTTRTVSRGEVVDFDIPQGYTSCHWQISTDAQNFVDLPNVETGKLQSKVYVPSYFRAKLQTQDQKVLFSDTTHVLINEVKYMGDPSITGGGHGYVETIDGVPDASGIDIPQDRLDNIAGNTKKLSNWSNGQSMAVYYVNHPKGVVDTDMFCKLRLGSSVSFRVKVYDPDNMESALAEQVIALKGTGNEIKVPLMRLSFPRKAYYRYQIECLMGWQDIIEISRFEHRSTSAEVSYKAGFLSSPSVRLRQWKNVGSNAPTGRVYDWFYQEVMIPKESDIKGTYVMSIGALGYMGIQVNGREKGVLQHGVLFAMWDNGNTDNDENLPEYCRAGVLDAGPNVKCSRFGNEGTGVHAMLHGHFWESDTYVQFITNCRLEHTTYKEIINGKEYVRNQVNTLVSAWYNTQDGKGWKYIATLRKPNYDKGYDTWYSFLENFNWATGQAVRTGYYKNGYGRVKNTKKWYHFNSCVGGHSDGTGKLGSRSDYGYGASDHEEGAFFMTNGGYVSTNIKDKMVPLNKIDTPVDTINMAALESRIDLAISRDKENNAARENFEKNFIDKKNWKVIDFSSEEIVGEKNNGRANLVIDSNGDTYWHSQWKNGSSHCPHHLVIDMQQEYLIMGMDINMGPRGDRHMKAYNLYVSTDNEHWTKVYTDDNVPDQPKIRVIFDHEVSARYFKLEITESRSAKNDHVRIHEIEVSGTLLPTGVGSLEASALKVVKGQNELLLQLPPVLGGSAVSLYRIDGVRLFLQENVSCEETISIPLPEDNKGVYIISVQTNGQKISRTIVCENKN